MFRRFVYKKCLEFLEDFWNGEDPPTNEQIPFLENELRDRNKGWWNDYNCPYPSQKEAHLAVWVFVQKENRAHETSRKGDEPGSNSEEQTIKAIRENAAEAGLR